MNNSIYAEVCNEMLTRNTFIVAYSPKNIIQQKQNKKFFFLWGEAQLCLPFVCMYRIEMFSIPYI